jgi:hypothetical protein
MSFRYLRKSERRFFIRQYIDMNKIIPSGQLNLADLTPKEKKIQWLSHTGIEEMSRCPRCFWLSYKERIRLPEGIQSRLANRFDVVLKQYFDGYRKKNILPPIVEKKLPGRLENPLKEKYFHKFNDRYGFWGKFDECLVDDGKYIPIDFKTASSDPREKEILEAYQRQIDEYVYLLENNHRQTAGAGYLIFFYPDLSDEVHNGFPMVMHIKKVTAYPEEVPSRIEKAIKILENSIPTSSEDCSFCGWFERVKEYYL